MDGRCGRLHFVDRWPRTDGLSKRTVLLALFLISDAASIHSVVADGWLMSMYGHSFIAASV